MISQVTWKLKLFACFLFNSFWNLFAFSVLSLDSTISGVACTVLISVWEVNQFTVLRGYRICQYCNTKDSNCSNLSDRNPNHKAMIAASMLVNISHYQEYN